MATVHHPPTTGIGFRHNHEWLWLGLGASPDCTGGISDHVGHHPRRTRYRNPRLHRSTGSSLTTRRQQRGSQHPE